MGEKEPENVQLSYLMWNRHAPTEDLWSCWREAWPLHGWETNIHPKVDGVLWNQEGWDLQEQGQENRTLQSPSINSSVKVKQPLFIDPTLPSSWTRKLKQRKSGATVGKWDCYIQAPPEHSSKTFWSKPEIRRYFEKIGVTSTFPSSDQKAKGEMRMVLKERCESEVPPGHHQQWWPHWGLERQTTVQNMSSSFVDIFNPVS